MTKFLELKKLVGIKRIGPSSFNDNVGSGSQFAAQVWQEFIPLVIAAGLSPQRVMYGVSWPADEFTPPQNVHYFAGFEPLDGTVPEYMEELQLTGGNYFTYIYVGDIQKNDEGFQNAYNVAFPASGLTGRNGQHLEIYPEDYDPSAEAITFQILIPVK
ncbi:right oriC-binding transcriptional activator [Candidatus Nanopelagicaceae bacterium]